MGTSLHVILVQADPAFAFDLHRDTRYRRRSIVAARELRPPQLAASFFIRQLACRLLARKGPAEPVDR